MRLRPEELASHLASPRLLPIYLLSGDEPLQMGEAGDAIRHRARELGYSDRQVLQVENNFDWDSLAASSNTLSLFAELRLLELRLPNNKFGREGGAALSDYADAPPDDTVLVISCAKLDKAQQSGKWFKAIERVGAVIQIWPVESAAMVGWLQQRSRNLGLKIEPEAAQLLAERVEGNLLAAAQELEKLKLLFGEEAIDAERLEQSVADSARYDLFSLVDTALLGDAARVSRMVEGLRGEGVEPILLLWALTREIRSLAQMAAEVESGSPQGQVLKAHRVWAKRQGPVGRALQRHTSRRWGQMLRRAARIDRITKGAEAGRPWDELLQLSLFMAGTRVI